MRTEDDIIAFIEDTKDNDVLGFILGDLVPLLSFEKAKPYLIKGTTKAQWDTVHQEKDGVDIQRDMLGYIPFALEKALNHRGISASRSIKHLVAWLFLLGEDELLAFAQDPANYPQYGMPILKRICEVYGIPFPDNEDANRMAKGVMCSQGPQCGCG